MNFISNVEGHQIQVELKYCERCGGLWLRRDSTKGVYCASCRLALAAMPDPGEAPTPKTRRRKPRMPKMGGQREDFHCAARIDDLQGVAAFGGWA
jgi:hypothetical protein